MSLFDLFLKDRPKVNAVKTQTEFKMFNGYVPQFTSWGGEIYESELVRAAVNARATHVSKLKFEIKGSARPVLQNKLMKAPNQIQTWSQFLYRLSTILDIHNTAFIVPVFDEYGDPSGVFVALPEKTIVTQYGKQQYLVYEFSHGEKAAIELDYCGVMTKFQYKSDFFGEDNHALFPTMDLIHIQNQGIEEGVKSAATYRFYAQVNNFTKDDELAKLRKNFSEKNFGKEAEAGGLLLFPNTFQNINQIQAKPFTVAADEMKLIKENVYQYYMVNEDVLQNKAYGDAWSAFYEGAVEPFAIQFSEVMTKMLFTLTEQSFGNRVMLTANRLQFMTNKEKLDVSSQLADRGILNRDEVREIWNLPPLPNGEGQTYIIRGEYWNANEKINEENEDNEE